MAISKLLISIPFLLLTTPSLRAAEIPTSVVEECTTNPKIYYPTQTRVNEHITDEQKLSAVMDALRGPWIYETESRDAIYAGYHVRKHYLRFAIVFNDEGLVTVICDSKNMKQRKGSIHRKAPQWKDTLDTKIRAAFSRIERNLKSGKTHLNNLTELYRKGFVTKEEFETIKNRINAE